MTDAGIWSHNLSEELRRWNRICRVKGIYQHSGWKPCIKTLCKSEMPSQPTIFATSAMQLLEKRRELAEVEADLANEKEEFQVKCKILKQRREDLMKKEEELKQSIQKFDKFLKENDAKKIRAKNKRVTETELIKQKDKDILKLQYEQDSLIRKREDLKKKVEAYAIYPKYLEKVIKVSSEFQNIQMVNHRFEALFHAYDTLFQKYQGNQEIMKTIKTDLNNLITEKSNENMKYQNKLAALKISLETAKSKTLKWESTWVHIQNTAAKRTLDLGMIKMAIFNLYAHVKNTDMDIDAVTEDTDAQLTIVQEYIMQLREIMQDFKRMENS
ncbi:coiled-coil domain-containing protein 42 homolog isoform X1 [Hypanus sabinus]|uniref:coiled-coil domain-containing protein 42 homolog isoform X1 n=1 Tax=Hypanus sabinus TaxID=79690 RepID=UPI0028C447DB|nr:coiled-coil domain-containing protein 42 homolog isoform X1 [Hypanus sabinus]